MGSKTGGIELGRQGGQELEGNLLQRVEKEGIVHIQCSQFTLICVHHKKNKYSGILQTQVKILR